MTLDGSQPHHHRPELAIKCRALKRQHLRCFIVTICGRTTRKASGQGSVVVGYVASCLHDRSVGKGRHQ